MTQEQNQQVTFPDCVFTCWNTPELVSNYCRLSGEQLQPPPRSALDIMIDKATGHTPSIKDTAILHFIEFVREYVWDRLPVDARDPFWVALLSHPK